MDTFKIFKIIKNYTSECLQWSNKDWKTFFKKLPTKQILCKMLSRQTEKCPFQMLRTFIFKLNVASKPFLKKITMTNSEFRWSWKHCITDDLYHFLRNWFQLVTEKFEKKIWKCPLQTLRTFIFKLKVASKPFSKKLPMTNFDFWWSWRLHLTFPENGFNFVTQKLQKTENFHACSMNFKRRCLINGQRGTKIERTFTPK